MSAHDYEMVDKKMLKGLEYPATRMDIVACAEDNEASEGALEFLRALPDDAYENYDEIAENLYKIDEGPGGENLWSSQESGDIPEVHTDPIRKIMR